MKKILFFLLVTINFHSFSQEDSAFINFQRNLPISDIVETLTSCDCMLMRMRGELNDKEEKLVSRGQALLFGRRFNELDSLFNYSSDLIQLYAFGGICLTYPDSLTEKHLQILNKKGTVRIYEQGKKKFPTMPISEVAEMMHNSIARKKEEYQQQQKIQQLISDFITKYASSPESYISSSFEDYHVFSTHDGETLEKEEDSEVYSIKHIFSLQNNEGAIAELQVRFKIDSELKIMIIEEELEDESNTIYVYPPEFDWWFSTFGRALTENEQVELGLKN